MCKNDPVLREVVGDFFHFSTAGLEIDIRIDRAFIRDYPVARHHGIYKDIGENATSLTLCGLTEEEAKQLFAYFRKIKQITLDSLQLMASHSVNWFPFTHIQSVTLINCSIDRQLLDRWFEKMNKTLESVHIDRLTWEFPLPAELSFLLNLPRLRELSLQRTKVATFDYSISSRSPLESLVLRHLDTQSISIRAANGNKLRHLEIDTKLDIFLAGGLSALEHLSLRCGQGRSKRDHLSGLRCVDTLRELDYNLQCEINHLLRFKNLRSLKVPCNWYEKEDWTEQLKVLEQLNSIELICHPPSVDGKTLKDTINDDLVLRIMAYLSPSDWLNLGRVFPHFLTLVSAQQCLTIDQQFLKEYPLDDDDEKEDDAFYDNLGAGVRILNVSSIKEADFLKVIWRFKKLQELRLESLQLEDVEGVVKVPRVDKLFIGCCGSVTEAYWMELFRRLDDRLLSLTVDEPNYPLMELHNLREVSSDAFADAEVLKAFLQQNRRLKKMSLSSNRSRDPFVGLIGEGEVIEGEKGEEEQQENQKVDLREVNFLVIRFEQIVPMLQSIKEDALRSLKVTSYSNKGQLVELLKEFTNLESLMLNTAVDWKEQNLEDLSALVHLTHLRIDGAVTESVAMQIIRQLPRLESLEFGSQVPCFSLGFKNTLIKFLRDSGRRFAINKNDAISRWEYNSEN